MEIRIREWRKRRGLTLKALADKISTTPQTVQRLETKRMNINLDWLKKLAGALMVEPADLLGHRNADKCIPLVGYVHAGGAIRRAEEEFYLEVPTADAVAVKLADCVGQ